jgi:hypothetical protein
VISGNSLSVDGRGSGRSYRMKFRFGEEACGALSLCYILHNPTGASSHTAPVSLDALVRKLRGTTKSFPWLRTSQSQKL